MEEHECTAAQGAAEVPTRKAGIPGAGVTVAIIGVGTYGRDTDEVVSKPLKTAMTGEKCQVPSSRKPGPDHLAYSGNLPGSTIPNNGN